MNMEASHVAILPQELVESSDKDSIESQTNRSDFTKEAILPESSFQCDDLQTSFSRNLCINDQTDLEARKSCEARWMQLFQLVERQCQEQIDAQQEQFKHQLQLIRDEIKHLAHLHGDSTPRSYGTDNAILPVTYDTHSLKPQDELHLRDEERGKNSSNPLHLFSELDICQRAFITQEHFLENTSLSSGYGTHSASEPNACLSSCSQNTSRETRLPAKQTLKECRTESIRPHDLKQFPENEKPFKLLLPGVRCHLESSEGHSSEQPKSNLNCDKSTTCNNNHLNRSLTTWAQKLKRNHCKKSTKMDQIPAHSTNFTPEQELECTDGSSNTFYLNNRTESANSLFSGGSGFTYWMMDEKEMYHPLPENFETGVSKIFSFKEPEEVRISSLIDIYHQKQREREQCSGWEPLSPSEHTHPPEVLTLDPTLHRKPSHNAALSQSAGHCSESYMAPVTPDSIVENPPFNHDEEETASNASSLLGDSSNRSPQYLAAGDKHCKSARYKVMKNIDYQLCHREAYSDERTNCTEDEANSLASTPISQSPISPADSNMPCSPGIYPMDHPVMLSNIRRSLREKHARHLADLRDYYESEISNLKQQLLANNKCTTMEDQMKINSLTERCAQMEGALTEASKRIHVLENKNSELEIQVAEWKERYHTANGTSKDLQEQIEEMRARNKEKENAISRLQSRLKEVEESLQKTIRQSDDKEARIKQEHKMFQDLLLEYESLGKEHKRVKDTLGVTENTLCDTHSEMNVLKRTVSKLETQIKKLEYDNMVKGQLWSPRPNNEILHTSSNSYGGDVSVRKCLTSEADCSIFTGKPLDNKAKEMESRQDIMYTQSRYHTPPEKDAVHDILASKLKAEDSSSAETPILRALKDYEEERELKLWNTFTNKDGSFHKLPSKRHLMGVNDSCTPRGSPEKSKERQRQSNSPCGPRSSSLPPSNRKSVSTPTKRELMLTPLTVKYSPKRSPSENLSPGLSQLLHSEENTVTRFNVSWADTSTFKNHSPRKRLQFMSLEDPEVRQKTIINSVNSSESQFPLLLPPFETEITYNERMKTISETERLFDELTEEKKQIEAALSRMPGTGRRLSLKMRATKESLEDRLEKINRELGSIRMTLKKYHVLPTSANI